MGAPGRLQILPDPAAFCLHSARLLPHPTPFWRTLVCASNGSRKLPQYDLQETPKIIPKITKTNVEVFLRSLFELLLGLILSSKASLLHPPKVDSVFVFAVDLEQPRFGTNPRFDLIFDPKIRLKLVQNRIQNLLKPGSKNDPKIGPTLAQNWL